MLFAPCGELNGYVRSAFMTEVAVSQSQGLSQVELLERLLPPRPAYVQQIDGFPSSEAFSSISLSGRDEAFSGGAVSSQDGLTAAQFQEVLFLRESFRFSVKPLVIEPDSTYARQIFQDARRRLVNRLGDSQAPQYFVYVDRNPEKQLLLVGFFSPDLSEIVPIGWSRVSTGYPQRKGHFETPTGVFENTVEIMNYRALGTKNSKGWRGLGRTGARVYDFGWQETAPKKEGHLIRLLLHATDPDYGEPRLGKRNSKGCVRISGTLNLFLDRNCLLDQDYLAGDEKIRAFLRKDRKPVSSPGRFMIVGDSGEYPAAR